MMKITTMMTTVMEMLGRLPIVAQEAQHDDGQDECQHYATLHDDETQGIKGGVVIGGGGGGYAGDDDHKQIKLRGVFCDDGMTLTTVLVVPLVIVITTESMMIVMLLVISMATMG